MIVSDVLGVIEIILTIIINLLNNLLIHYFIKFSLSWIDSSFQSYLFFQGLSFGESSLGGLELSKMTEFLPENSLKSEFLPDLSIKSEFSDKSNNCEHQRNVSAALDKENRSGG